MRTKKILIVLLAAVFFIFVFFLTFNYFFWGKVEKVSDVTKETVLTLTTQNKYPTSIRILMTGHLDGDAKIFPENCISGSYGLDLKAGDIYLEFGDDQYDPTCKIKYQPLTVHSGKLEVRYEF